MLYHFSEDPTIRVFHPRPHPSNPDHLPIVWAIDADRAPLYFFPRDCPRVAYWKNDDTSEQDLSHFLKETSARMVIAIEAEWLNRLRSTELFVYELPKDQFQLIDKNAGYYVSYESVIPSARKPVGDLLDEITQAGVELRITPELHKLCDAVTTSTLAFSAIRMRNAKAREKKLGIPSL
jgi:hypothetical protein